MNAKRTIAVLSLISIFGIAGLSFADDAEILMTVSTVGMSVECGDGSIAWGTLLQGTLTQKTDSTQHCKNNSVGYGIDWQFRSEDMTNGTGGTLALALDPVKPDLGFGGYPEGNGFTIALTPKLGLSLPDRTLTDINGVNNILILSKTFQPPEGTMAKFLPGQIIHFNQRFIMGKIITVFGKFSNKIYITALGVPI